MAALIPQKMFDEQLAAMDIENFAQATIRQVGAVGGALEKNSGTEFLHLEMGVPGLPPETVGVEAEQQALAQGHASIYPSITGIAPLKSEASRFVKAFLDIDVAPEGCIPTVGSMQGGFCLFQISSQCDPKKDTILFIDPGFPVQRQQVRILGIKHESFDIYDFRAEKLGPKLESYLKQGNVAAIIYSNPNNPAWICLTESELRTIGELATKYDTIVLEDLAYMGMDFRKELGHPFQAPFQLRADDFRLEDLQLRRPAHRHRSDLGQTAQPLLSGSQGALRHRPFRRILRPDIPLRRIVRRKSLGSIRFGGHVQSGGGRQAGLRGAHPRIRTPRSPRQGTLRASRFPHRL